MRCTKNNYAISNGNNDGIINFGIPIFSDDFVLRNMGRYFGLVPQNVHHIRKNVYRVCLNDYSLRLDIDYAGVEPIRIQQRLNDEKVVGIGNFLDAKNIRGKIWKTSEWKDGLTLKKINNDNGGIGFAVMYENLGEVIAKVNGVRLNDGYVIIGEVSSANVVWTKENQSYIVDLEKLGVSQNPALSTAVSLLKRIQIKAKIESFLAGYDKYNNASRIVDILDEYNWEWAKRGKPSNFYESVRFDYDGDALNWKVIS